MKNRRKAPLKGRLHPALPVEGPPHALHEAETRAPMINPYDNIRWVVPEGGGGPQYTVL